MPRVVLNGTVLAESTETVKVEGNHYFPPSSINKEYFRENDRHTSCFWKGLASYYDVQVEGQVYPSKAWTYHDPSKAAANIRDYVAFYLPVEKDLKPEGEAGGESTGGVKEAISRLFGG